MACFIEQCNKRKQEHEDYDSVYTLGKKKQKIIDNDMDWTRGGVVKLKDFSIRLTRLKEIHKRIATLKPHRCGNAVDQNSDNNCDDLICCVSCGKSYYGNCPIHGPLIPLDESLGWDQDSKSFTSVPVPLQVTVKISSIINAGKGVFAKEFIPRRTRIGPYKGEVVQKEDVTDETDTSYFWEVKNVSESYYIDAKNEEHASWLRFINCARNEKEQNLVSFQYQGNIYCYTTKDILPGTELLVWYGEQYVKLLGLTVDYMFDANYTCIHCKTRFVEKRNLDIHLKCCQADPDLLKCGKCGEVFTTLINLQQHIRRHEQNIYPTSTYSSSQEVSNSSTSQTPIPAGDSEHFQCEFCDKSFTQNEDLQEHLQTHSGDNRYECQYCSKTFKYRSWLKNHMLTHKKEKRHHCQYCSKSFRQKNKLISHLLNHTGEKPYQCQHCLKSFTLKYSLVEHLRIHTGEKPYVCEHCGESFGTKRKLNYHMITHAREKPYHCNHCSKKFSTTSGLQYHMTSHTGDKPYKCQYCGKAFPANTALKFHLRTHTGEKPYSCKHCSKAYAIYSYFLCHLRTHTGEKPFQCQYCDKTFTQQSHLKSHTRTHTGEKPYQCQYCSKAFTQSSHLRVHLRIHTGEKPYKCDYCDKGFATSGTKKTHMRIHTGERPYKCLYCSKACSQSTELKVHMRTHTGEKPHQCQYCGKAFRETYSLKRHLKQHTKYN